MKGAIPEPTQMKTMFFFTNSPFSGCFT